MTERTPLLSVVAPFYYSEKTAAEFYRRLKAVAGGLAPGMDHELIFVNDGSKDRTLEMLRDIAARDAHVRVLELSRNFGHQIAITAGIDAAHGDAVAVIDDDLQDPPEVILEMLAKWREGYKVVYGVRTKRKGENALKRGSAKLFYRLLNRLSEMPLPLDTGDFRLMDRQVVDVLKDMREENRYVRGMVAWVGFRQLGLPYERDARYAGETHYTLGKLFELAVAGIMSFSRKPLELSTRFGLAVTAVAFLAGVWVITGKLLHPGTVIAGWASVLIAVLFMGGVQLISVGVLGAYLGRVFYETKRRPLYVVAEDIGAPAEDDE
ncbi:MAG TPA: glycosyltransferase family 2 protein [Coriobacteriia bacterium]|jgi:dolichol-phosphate mannosyltransferase